MKQVKKNREAMASMILRSKTRFMHLTLNPETGVEIKDEKGQVLGVAFPDSELALKFLQGTLALISKDAELTVLEHEMESRSGTIVRPRGPIPIS